MSNKRKNHSIYAKATNNSATKDMLSLISNSENSLKAMKKNDNAEIIFNTESIKLVKKPAVTSKNSNSHSKAELTPKI